MSRVSIVVQAYHNARSLQQLLDALRALAARHADDVFQFVFGDDGSGDDSYRVLLELARGEPHIKVVKLSRNFGSNPAILAGLEQTAGDAVVAHRRGSPGSARADRRHAGAVARGPQGGDGRSAKARRPVARRHHRRPLLRPLPAVRRRHHAQAGLRLLPRRPPGVRPDQRHGGKRRLPDGPDLVVAVRAGDDSLRPSPTREAPRALHVERVAAGGRSPRAADSVSGQRHEEPG